MVAQRVFQFLQESDVASLSWSQTLFVLQTAAATLVDLSRGDGQTHTLSRAFTHQNRNDAFVLLFNQVTNDFVVKVLHRLPLETQGRNVFAENCKYLFAGLKEKKKRS